MYAWWVLEAGCCRVLGMEVAGALGSGSHAVCRRRAGGRAGGRGAVCYPTPGLPHSLKPQHSLTPYTPSTSPYTPFVCILSHLPPPTLPGFPTTAAPMRTAPHHPAHTHHQTCKSPLQGQLASWHTPASGILSICLHCLLSWRFCW